VWDFVLSSSAYAAAKRAVERRWKVSTNEIGCSERPRDRGKQGYERRRVRQRAVDECDEAGDTLARDEKRTGYTGRKRV